MVRKEIFEKAGGFDETNFAISFNDIDFCLRLRAAGLQNVWTPYANLVHHESASRGHQRAPEEQAQFVREATFMQGKWGIELMHDPFYNPNLSLNLPGFELAVPPRLPESSDQRHDLFRLRSESDVGDFRVGRARAMKTVLLLVRELQF